MERLSNEIKNLNPDMKDYNYYWKDLNLQYITLEWVLRTH